MGKAIIIHGGILEFERLDGTARDYDHHLRRIVVESYHLLEREGSRSAVIHAVMALEDCELFNAGTGSRIQEDGEIRMSASLMDGSTSHFSGVINIQYVKNPILIAAKLAKERNPILASECATSYARASGFSHHDPATAHRIAEHRARQKGRSGTVGAVAIDERGTICAATSTGGVGGEMAGRVGDSATVAGNYATKRAGISCTGIGEEIINLTVASRIATRQLDGSSLQDAVAKTIAEGRQWGYFFGLIAMDEEGKSVVDQTQGTTLYAAMDERRVRSFLT